MKFGGQLIRFQQNRFYAGNNGVLGIFRFNGSYSGVDFADFLLNQLSAKAAATSRACGVIVTGATRSSSRMTGR